MNPGKAIDKLKGDITRTVKDNILIDRTLISTEEFIERRKLLIAELQEKSLNANLDWNELFRD